MDDLLGTRFPSFQHICLLSASIITNIDGLLTTCTSLLLQDDTMKLKISIVTLSSHKEIKKNCDFWPSFKF